MTTPSILVGEPVLEPCPFCGDPMRHNAGQFEHVTQTPGCPMRDLSWPDERVADWNKRATAFQPGKLDGPVAELVERLRRVHHLVNPDGPEAATAIETLSRELEACREALRQARLHVAADVEQAEQNDSSFLALFAERLARVDAALHPTSK